MTDFRELPIDDESAEQLRARGLRLGLVDTGDSDSFERWLLAVEHGFYESPSTDESIREQVAGMAGRRTTGVWDDTAIEPATPAATVSSWPTALTVPGGATCDAWAISAVTVSPAYRRRGIAKALLESELRTAARLGLPLAILTVSESTIYGRFGFAPTALSADFTIDTQRARWVGPTASGRVQLVPPRRLLDEGQALMERARLRVPGEIEMHGYKWRNILGLVGDKLAARSLRAARYEDTDGTLQGFAIYKVNDTGPNFAAQTLDLQYLFAATDDAYAGLWSFLLQLDLVSTITAGLRAVDEPLAWQVADFRAVRKTGERDHLWARILDPKAALEARRYAAPGRIVLQISDPLGFADGRVLLDVDADGVGTVTPFSGELPDDTAGLSLSVHDLGALYLGGVSCATLVRSGRVTELREGSGATADASFRAATAPWLSFWF